MIAWINAYAKQFIDLFGLLRLLNLDVPAGVLCGVIYASKLLNVSLSPVYYVTLFLAVWSIYCTDHIIDGIRSKDSLSISEYRFHYKYRRILISLIFLFALLGAFLAFRFLDFRIIVFGLSMIFMVLIYFIVNVICQIRGLKFFKEITIALLYTGGIFGGVIILNENNGIFHWLNTANYFLLVYSNVLLLALFEMEKDRILQFHNLALQFGTRQTRFVLYTVLFLSVVLSTLAAALFKHWNVVVIPLLMALSFLIISLRQKHFQYNNTYGLITDSVFFLPVLSVWM